MVWAMPCMMYVWSVTILSRDEKRNYGAYKQMVGPTRRYLDCRLEKECVDIYQLAADQQNLDISFYASYTKITLSVRHYNRNAYNSLFDIKKPLLTHPHH